jgi:hypothetical protein
MQSDRIDWLAAGFCGIIVAELRIEKSGECPMRFHKIGVPELKRR